MTSIRKIATGSVLVLTAISLAGAAMAQQQQQRRQPARAQADAGLEQAWHTCLQWVDRTAPRTGENDSQRTAQFKACMAQRGFTR